MKRTGPPKRKTPLRSRGGPSASGKGGRRSGSAPHKRGPWRSEKYLAFVRTLPCCHCGRPADSAHHIIGVGNMGGVGTKAPDHMTMPVCDGPQGCHDLIHRTPSMWPDQWEWVRQTQQQAVEAGWLTEVTV